MDLQKQRIAIAEFCGWKDIKTNTVPHMTFIGLVGTCDGSPHLPIPNYLEDLNAMHEAEKLLTREQQRLYTRLLHPEYVDNLSGDWCVLHSAAGKRADAFTKVIGKWEEE